MEPNSFQTIPLIPTNSVIRIHALGHAIAAWQFVEQELCRVFFTVLNHRTAGTLAYYSIVNFNARLNMVHSVALNSSRDQQLVNEWNVLVKQMNKKAAIRNKLAHFSVDIVTRGSGETIARLMPHPTDVGEFRKADEGRGTAWTAKNLIDFADDFHKLSSVIEAFGMKVSHSKGRP